MSKEQSFLDELKDAPVESPAPPQEGAQPAVPDVQPAQPAPATPAAPVPTEPAIPAGYVPLAAVLDTRDKLKSAEQRAKDLESKLQATQQPQKTPDPVSEPEEFNSYLASQAARLQFTTRAEISETMAREKHGDEIVDKAIASFDEIVAKEPWRIQQLWTQRHPVEWLVNRLKRQERDSQIGDDLDAFVRRRATELGLVTNQPQVPSPAAPQQPARPATPSPSLASAPAAAQAASQPMGSGVAFDAIFKR